ncbi:MAG: alpha-1,4-glucan--maltose-1-phosphate maltosyltransferase [Deltaproteobacteria bacterium]|nr:alpha-1,4-glucan--maltose-1-phosphate maltosyltransferase [Deltaproteobacteria bacterium]
MPRPSTCSTPLVPVRTAASKRSTDRPTDQPTKRSRRSSKPRAPSPELQAPSSKPQASRDRVDTPSIGGYRTGILRRPARVNPEERPTNADAPSAAAESTKHSGLRDGADARANAGPGRARVLIERVDPAVDGGRFAVKRVVGEAIDVEATLIADGHDVTCARLLFRRAPDAAWQARWMTTTTPGHHDRFAARIVPDAPGAWGYTVEGWIDRYSTWLNATEKKLGAGQDINVELAEGAAIIENAVRFPPLTGFEQDEAGEVVAEPTGKRDGGGNHDDEDASLKAVARGLADGNQSIPRRLALAQRPEVRAQMARRIDPETISRHPPLPLTVDRRRAQFGAWYEFFPRSFGENGQHGTFQSAQRVLPYVAEMGFDILYLPPIHPIGRSFRKGRNNTLHAGPTDPGSPWAIGDESGGHKSIHPALGTFDDFEAFIRRAHAFGLEVALDIAFQASADHPYVKAHPEWFRRRPDGSIQYAENPPKKYQDIYPFDFECEDWPALWHELLSVFEFWIEHGIRIFRVDNPHTKSLRFWAWCIEAVKTRHPEVIFLAEAFARPALMYGLAKRGFTQSYTYFTWRRTAWELKKYVEELTRTEVKEYFRPNFWPNTPDILPEHLQYASRAEFTLRVILAATLSSNYGIYGPAYELLENIPREGSGEYLDNEKYELKRWHLERSDSLKDVLQRINAIRRETPALQQTRRIDFHETDNEQLLCFSKSDDDGRDLVIVVVNLDAHHRHSGWVMLDLDVLGLDARQSFQVHDLLTNGRHIWSGGRNYVELDPTSMPAHIFKVRRHIRREHDFDYFA